MSLSESKKKANVKWDKEHMKTVSVRLRKEQAEKFKQVAEQNGFTTAGALKKFILSQIGESETDNTQTKQ